MLNYDYHLHTSFSVDSEEPMENTIKRAIELNFKEIAITDHWDYLYPESLFPHQINYDEYVITFQKLKEKYASKISLLFGVEIGIGPHLGRAISEFVNKYNFDFIIGSIHDIKGQDLYFSNYFKGVEKKEAYTTYFQYCLDSIKAVKEICVFGHLDYVSRYGGYDDPMVYYEEFKEIIDEILIELIKRDKGIEINTSGYRYGINGVYPQLDIIKRYKELGGKIITVGSDAHKAIDVGKNFEDVYKILKDIGFEYITVFRNRKPEFIKI